MAGITLELLLARNRNQASRASHSDPDYFRRHQSGQTPGCLWVGCADSRVPAESLVQAGPGELFVLRNVASQVLASDDGVMSGIQYALTSLEVDTVIICGHTDCGGVAFAGRMAMMPLPQEANLPLQRQLLPLSKVLRERLERYPAWKQLPESQLQRLLVEENVSEQVRQLQQMPLFQSRVRYRPLALYGCVYDITTGLLDVLSENRYEELG